MLNITRRTLTALAAATALTFSAGLAHAQTVNLTAETSGGGASNHVVTAALGELAASEGVANFQILGDQVLTNSVLNLANGQTDMAATPFILPFLLSKGAGPYANVGAEKGSELVKNMAVLFTYAYGGMSLYSFNSSPVKGWGDVAGRRILNGPPQGAALTNGRALIQLVTGLKDGEGYTGVQVDWGQAVKTVTDGTVDAAVLPVYLPDPRMTQASAAGTMTLYSVPKEIYDSEPMQKYMKSPGTGSYEVEISKVTLPENITIKSEDGIFRSPATVGGNAVRADMDFDLAYKLTRVYLDNLDTIASKSPIMRFVNLGETDPKLTGMCGPNPLKYHPGAVKAFEDTGRTIPDCAKP